MADAIKRMQNCRTKMLVKHPFWASLMMGMPMIYTDAVSTAATDMKTIWISPKFIDEIDDDVLMFVLAHEIMHVALENGFRQAGRDNLDWNRATDYANNLILKDGRFKIWDKALCDDRFRGMSAEQIYAIIRKEKQEQPQPQPQPQQGQPGQSGGAGGQQPPPPGQGQPQPGNGPPPPPAGNTPGDPHYSPMLGDLIAPECSGNKVEEDKLKRDIQQRVAQAAAVAKMCGQMSADIEKFVKDVLEPKVPWYETLRHFLTESAPTDEDWSRRNTRFHHIYLPIDNSPDRLKRFIGIGDTSGSISDEEMGQFVAEWRMVAEDLKPEEIRLIWADRQVKGEQVFEYGEEMLPRPRGGGGTDMRVPLKYIEDEGLDPEFVVLFTDGETPWPTEEPPFPLIVCCTTGANVPVGEVIRI